MKQPLYSSDEFNHSLIYSMQEGYQVLDSKGTAIDANPALCKITGFSQKELIGVSAPFPYWPPEHYANIQTAFAKTLEGTKDYSFELIFMRKNGERFPVIVSPSILRNTAGEIIGYAATIKDITELKRTEENLHESKQLLTTILQALPLAVFAKNIKNNFQFSIWNKSAEELFGFKAEDCIGKSDHDLFPKEQADFFKAKDIEASKIVGIIDIPEEPAQTAHGASVLHTRKTVLRDLQGEPSILLGITEDITERKKAETEKDRALNLLQQISSRVPGVIYQFLLRADGSSCFPFASEAIRQIYQVSPEDVREDASKVFGILHPEDYDAVVASIQKSAQDLTAWVHEYRVKFNDGTVRWLLGNSLPTRNEDGSTLWHGFITDITERKKVETALKESEEKYRILLNSLLEQEKNIRVQAESANRIKDEFLATLSHELRTPLTTILSWTQLLRRGNLDPDKTKRGLEVLEQSAKAQSQLIDDLLDITRIQAGKLSLAIQKIEPSLVISAALESTRSLAASKSIQIQVTIDPNVKYHFADPVRLQQIFWNLLTNSIKFSPQNGKIWINLDRVESPSGEQLRIQVRDNGKGINPDFIPVIFDRFTQVDSTSTRSYGGLGLGLAIVKKLVEMHEGTISVESPGENKGTTFTILFPVKPTSAIHTTDDIDVKTEVSLSGLRILLVDDDVSAREVFAIILKNFGAAEVKTAGSASDALATLEEFKPDILVSDIAMPIEDGYSLIAKVRALKSKFAAVPSVALTAYAGQEDIERMHLAGFQSHVAKPTDAYKLALEISRLAARR